MYFLDKEIKSVAILMPEKHMGNVIISLPSILSLSNLFKDSNLCVVVDERYADIIDAFIKDAFIIPYPRISIKNASIFKKIKLLYSVVKKLRIQKPDITIDLEGRTVGPVQSFLSGSDIKIGFESSDKSFLYDIKVPSRDRIHKSKYYLLMPHHLGFNKTVNLKMRVKELWLEELSQKINLDERIITIHPSAGKIYKKWSYIKFAEVADYFARNGYMICFIGSSNDSKDIAYVREKMNEDSIDLSGQLTIRELIALFKVSSLFIGNDSGPMHLSSLIGTPTIALFGPADVKRWSPIGEKSIVIEGDFRCKKCKGKDCLLEFKCMDSISVEQVIISAEELLGNKNGQEN